MLTCMLTRFFLAFWFACGFQNHTNMQTSSNPCSIKHVIAGERTSTAKISNATPLIFAAPFHVNGAPGLVTLAQREGEEAVLQVSKQGRLFAWSWRGFRPLLDTAHEHRIGCGMPSAVLGEHGLSLRLQCTLLCMWPRPAGH